MRSSGLILVVLVVLACAGAPALGPTATVPATPGAPVTLAPTALPTITSSPQPTPSAVPTPTASMPSPTATATPAPTPRWTLMPPDSTGYLHIKWVNPPGASGLEGLSDITSQASSGGRLVIAGSREVPDPPPPGADWNDSHCEPAIWWSDNATIWHLAQLPDGYTGTAQAHHCRIWDVAAGGVGFVAATDFALLWSVDGAIWTEAVMPVAAFAATLRNIGATPGGLIAYGWDSDNGLIPLESSDGRAWTTIANAKQLAGYGLEFVPADGLTVFATRSSRRSSTTVVWRVTAPDKWVELARISDNLRMPSFGSRGWIAFGDKDVWLSPDGRSWSRGGGNQPLGSPRWVDAGAVDESGYVAAVSVEPPGCVISETDIVGHTWTSIDGRDWREMNDGWRGKWLNAFFVIDRMLVGVGQGRDRQPDYYGFVRVAAIPQSHAVAASAPTPFPTPTPNEGCGD